MLAVPIRTILPSIFTSLMRISDAEDPLKIALNEMSYKPFISLFNITQAAVANPLLAGIVDYASAVSFELHSAGTAEPTVNMRFKNGTTDPVFHDLTLFGKPQLGLSQFIGLLAVRAVYCVMFERRLFLSPDAQPSAVNNTQQWCTACNQTVLRGCSVFNVSGADGVENDAEAELQRLFSVQNLNPLHA